MLFRTVICSCRHRLFEWVMTGIMLGLALEIAIWPNTIGASAFYYMLRVIGSTNLNMFFAVAGLLRVAALIANGTWPVVGPRIRACSAGAASIIWFQMVIALLLVAPVNGVPSPGIPVYLALTIGELLSAYRAATDVRTKPR
jgi:hypothetical protein